ncbi:MAG: cupin domain-containing protein [Candidatus Udaeobacter sp.]
MPNDRKIIHVGAGEGHAFSAAGDVYRILASGRQTGDVYALHEIRVSPNNGPPPHIHSREDESFFVLEGEVEFHVGDEKITGLPGKFIRGSRGIAHSFKNNTQLPARILVFVTPAGFENFFHEFARPVASFDSPAIPVSKDEVDKLLAAAPKYGLQVLSPNK